MALVDDCVFCRILKGEIPSCKVYEDDKVLAFLDIAPFNFGHTVIVPKDHHHSVTTLGDEYLSAMFVIAPKLATAIMTATGAEGFNLMLNNGHVAGQVVPHAHLHIVPRFADDAVLVSASEKAYESTEAMAEMAAKIQQALAKKASR